MPFPHYLDSYLCKVKADPSISQNEVAAPHSTKVLEQSPLYRLRLFPWLLSLLLSGGVEDAVLAQLNLTYEKEKKRHLVYY